jgi:hypothetical protein
MRFWFTLFGMLLLASTLNARSSDESAFFDQADAFFQEYVTADGTVHYRKLAEQPGALDELVAEIARADQNQMSGSTLKAFYLNAYNILTIEQLVEHYPISSPKDLDGFFNGITHTVAGQSMTLDDLEKRTLYKQFADARLHFALVCGAKGCPPIRDRAYQPDQLDEQLDEQTRRAMADENFIRIQPEERLVEASKIFQWYRDDFLEEASSILDYINQYRPGQLPADTRVRYYSYDWGINSVNQP